MLRTMQKAKLNEVEKLFRDLFGLSIDVEEYQALTQIGLKHQQVLEKESKNNQNYTEIYQAVFNNGGLNAYFDTVSVTVQKSQKLIDS